MSTVAMDASSNTLAARFTSQSDCEQFVKRAVSSGQLLIAIHAAREGLAVFDSNPLRQQLSLALVQTGAFEAARQLLSDLVLKGEKTEETLCLMGRVYKELWRHETNPGQAKRALQKSKTFYEAAYKRFHSYYPGINLAFILAMSGKTAAAERCAREVAELCREALSDPGQADSGWLWATLGEAQVQLGQIPAARKSYRKAVQHLAGRWRDLSTMRRQARELLRYRNEDSTRIEDCFDLPSVVAFVGHMLDHPRRESSRFSPASEPGVRKKISQYLESAKPGFGYSSAACGADILFCESLLEKNAELHLVLPCPVTAFKRTSVRFAGKNWERRFDQILSVAKTCTIANPAESTASETTPLSSLGYVYTNQIITGLATLQARALDLEMRTLAVWDGKAGDGTGGTASAVSEWITQGRAPFIIHPASTENRGSSDVAQFSAMTSSGLCISEMQQDIKAILFADVAGYSRLSEGQVREFIIEFMGAVSSLIAATKPPPIIMQTWGDGLYFVFDQIPAAAAFALKLRDLVTQTAWNTHGLPPDLSIRIAVHAGPVFACINPIMRQLTFTGAHVTRAARIEPVTARGQVFTSQEFAALCAAEGNLEFGFEFLGQLPTAKNFGHAPLYRLFSQNDLSSCSPRI